MPNFSESLATVATAMALLPSDSEAFASLTDTELTDVPRLLAQARHRMESCEAAIAGEIARRSTRELGFQGLAQKTGFRTAEGLLQHLTGSTSREAAKLVRTGIVMQEAELVDAAQKTGDAPPELTRPWLAAVGRAVTAGTLSIEAAEAIRLGLGAPTEDIPADALAVAAARLVDDATTENPSAGTVTPVDAALDPDGLTPVGLNAPGLNADQLLIRARAVRDELDEAGIADRERARRNARSLRRYRRPDGMTVFSLTADPENATYLDGIYDCLTSPRRGGPRMVDLADTSRAEAIETDPRTLEQLSFDGFLAMLRIGASTDEKTAARSVLGSRRPAVRVLVSKTSLDAGAGHGRIEGQDAPVSIETIERIVCGSGTVPILFDDDGQCVNLGREQRLFTARQRIGLAARDGGCRWPECTRPASWTEAHHIDQWKRDDGNTDIADGILLCRYHHLLLHDNHWDITRTGGQYRLLPPASEDPHRTPRSMPHKSAALTDLQREQGQRTLRVQEPSTFRAKDRADGNDRHRRTG